MRYFLAVALLSAFVTGAKGELQTTATHQLTSQPAPSTLSPNSTLILYALPWVLDSLATTPANWTVSVCNNDTKAVDVALTASPTSAGPGTALRISYPNPTIEPRQCEPVTLTLTTSNPLLSGWRTLELDDHKTPIGNVGLSVHQKGSLPTKLDLRLTNDPTQTTSTTPVTLVSVYGSAPQAILVNNANTYVPIAWHIEADAFQGSGTTELPPTSSQRISIHLTTSTGKPHPLASLWPYSANGYLVLQTPGSQANTPLTQYVPIKIKTTYFSPLGQDVWTTLLVFILLATGGILSFLTQNGLPNVLRRKDALKRLVAIQQQTRGLDAPPLLETISTLRTIRHQLQDRARQLPWFSNQATTDWNTLTGDIDDLQARVDGANTLNTILASTTPPAGFGLGLLATQRVVRLCQKAARVIEDQDADLTTAHDPMSAAKAISDQAGQEQPDLTDDLTSTSRTLLAAIDGLQNDNGWRTLTAQTPWYPQRLAILKLDSNLGGQLAQERALHSITLLLDLFLSPTITPAEKATIVTLLQDADPTSLAEVQQRLSDLQNDLNPDTFERALREGAVTLAATRTTVTAYDPVAITAWFNDERLNRDGSRDRTLCKWTTTEDQTVSNPATQPRRQQNAWRWISPSRTYFSQDRTEATGWKIFRFFPASTFTVKLTAIARNRKPTETDWIEVPQEPSVTITVLDVNRYPNTRKKWIEIARVCLLQLIPLCALLATLGGDLQTQNPLAGCLILIAAGFTADAAKNALTTGISALNRPTMPSPPGTPLPANSSGNPPAQAEAPQAPGAPPQAAAAAAPATTPRLASLIAQMNATPKP